MELRMLAVCVAFLLVAVTHCSGHSLNRQEADDVNYDDPQMADEANDDETLNDTDIDAGETTEVPATILTKPANYEITIGRTVRLECKVDPETTVVQWFKDNQSYFIGNMKTGSLDTDKISIVQDSKDLLIKDLNSSDNGVYRCETVQNKPVAINHTLIVLETARIINFSATDNGHVVEGSDLVLTCDVAGSPTPKIMWTREGISGNVRLNEKDGEFTVNSVTIKNIKREQAGKYYCYVINSAGNSQAEVRVTVLGKPRVHVHKTIVNSGLNMEAVLQCSVHEEAAPHIRWLKDGNLIEDSSTQFSVTTQGTNSNLTVIPAAAEDFGTFTCEAENAHGKHSKSVDLVQSPVVEQVEVEGTKLSWTVHSHQPLEAIEITLRDRKNNGEFRRLSVPLPPTQGHKYELVYLLEDKQLDPGTYETYVKVKNDHSWGSSKDPALVEIEAQPQYIQHASVFRTNNAHSIRPAAVITTALMYLLVRML